MGNIHSNNSEESFDSRSIRVNLNGPITSIEAVANNLPRADGRSEWEHLLGKPLDYVMSQQTFDTIDKTIGTAQSHAGITENLPDNYNQRTNIIVQAFQKHAPELIEALKKSYQSNIYDALPAKTKEILIGNKLQGDLHSLLHLNEISGGGAAYTSPNGGALILMIDPELTPRQAVSGRTGIPENELPSNIPGSPDFWRANTILHELEHLLDQDFKYKPNAPKDIQDYEETLSEIDSDFASNTLLSPHTVPERIQYLENIRMIGTMNKLTRMPVNSERETHHGHAVAHPLAHIGDIRKGDYSIPNHLDDLNSLSEQIRETLGVDDHTYIYNDILTFQDLTQAVKNLVTRDTAARGVMTNYNSVEPLLSDDERNIAQQFLKAVDEVGFTAMWKNETTVDQNATATSGIDNANNGNGQTYKP